MPKQLEFKPADLTKEVVAEERSNSRVAVQEAYSTEDMFSVLSQNFTYVEEKD